MVTRPLLIAFLPMVAWSCVAGQPPSAPPRDPAVQPVAVHEPLSGQQSVQIDFATEIQPILAGCTPCHFPGGKMYAALPFDRPETVSLLGDKLFSRIDDPVEQDLVRRFLDQEAAAGDRGSSAGGSEEELR